MLKLAANARIMDELAADELDVALPLSASDVDLVAFLESAGAPHRLVFVPIHIVFIDEGQQISAALQATGVAEGITALVWDRGHGAAIRCFALTSTELALVKMTDRMHGAKAPNGAEKHDSIATGGSKLVNALEPFAMTSGKWRKKLCSIVADGPNPLG